jgi:hypothetical protein
VNAHAVKSGTVGGVGVGGAIEDDLDGHALRAGEARQVGEQAAAGGGLVAVPADALAHHVVAVHDVGDHTHLVASSWHAAMLPSDGGYLSRDAPIKSRRSYFSR